MPCSRSSARSFQGYRLLHEYFKRFPTATSSRSSPASGPAVRRCPDAEIELLVLTDEHNVTLDGAVSADALALFCTPAINLFSRRADRIHLSDATPEYHVVPDRTRPMDFEIFSVGEVVGTGAGDDVKQTFPSVLRLPGTIRRR